jgi:azurin
MCASRKLSVFLLGFLLSSAGSATPTSNTAPAKPAPAKSAAAKKAPAAPAGKVCKVDLGGSDLMQFDRKELKVVLADCPIIEVVLKHTGKLPLSAMGHNFVLTRSADATNVNNAGLAVGVKNNHVPPNDKRVIAFTPLVGGGQMSSVKIPASALVKGGDYTFFCSFPGHYGLMRGKFIVQ